MSFQQSFSRFRKKAKDKLSKIGKKQGGRGATVGAEGFDRSASSLRSEPGIVAEGEVSGEDIKIGAGKEDPGPGDSESASRSAVETGRDSGGSNDHSDRQETSQKGLHPHPRVQAESGASQERKDGDGKRADQVDLLSDVGIRTPTPSISQGGESESKTAILDRVGVDATASKDESSWKSTASSSAKLFLRTVERASDAFPPLKSVAAGLCAILDNYEQTTVNKHTIGSLGHRVEALVESLCNPASKGDVKEERRRKDLERKLEDVRKSLDPMIAQKDIVQFLNNAENAQKLNDLVDDIHEAVMDYQTSLQQNIYNNSRQLIDNTDLGLLRGMHHVSDAGYLCGDRKGCMKGTRRDVLFQLERWSKDKQDRRVFWLNGLAGTGKSTIAQTFAEMCFADGKLGASFFCSRDFIDRSNLRSIFPTLAFQLAHRYEDFRQQLLPVLKTSPDVGKETLCSQMEKLIVGPFQVTEIQTLIVIDALDECQDEEPASVLLSVLSRYVDKIPLVKFFITGRPEPRIRSGFRLESLRPHTDVLKLHEVEPSSVDSDIKVFLKAQFIKISKNRSDCSLEEDWPGPHNIDILCKKAAGFFIYASTVVKFVSSRHYPPDERLALIVSLPQDTFHEGKLGIDLLYIQVLEQAFCDVDSHDNKPYSHFRSVVGAVLLVSHPLSINTLSDLLRNHGTPSRISGSLRTLHSVLLVPDSTEDPVRIFHKSFSDFLMDLKRCTNPQFFIDPSTHHKEIFFSCLNVMKERLKRNICKLDDHAVLSDIDDLSTLKTTSIGKALEYACHFWTSHLAKISDISEGMQKAIDNFFTTSFLFWIEVLILMGNLDIGVYALNDIEQWYLLTGVPCKWTSDSKRFILDNFDSIQDSPARMYNSALSFCPSSSWLCKYNTADVKAVVGSAGWGTCTRTVSISGYYTSTLAYWNNIIATGFVHKGIITFDALTGSQTAALSGHTGYVKSITFSSDGTLLVSGSIDKTIKLWDVQTGGVVKTFCGHTDGVLSVSISADNTTVASGSYGGEIRLWNIKSGECLIVGGHGNKANTITFSPTNPQLLLSSSDDGTAQQWGINGCKIGSPIPGSHVAFSLDGTQFVLCKEKTVTIRDTDSNMTVVKFNLVDNANYCCFSPSGKFIAVAATSHIIYLWDITGSNPCLIQTLIGHVGSITSLVFSSSLTLISASEDTSVKFWQIGHPSIAPDSGSTLLTSAPIKFVSLQAKDGLAFSFDSEGVVKTWDILTGCCEESYKTQVKDATCGDIQLISGRLIIIWYQEGKEAIYVWDTEKGEPQILNRPARGTMDLRIIGDGSRVVYLCDEAIEALSIWTGKSVGKETIEKEDHCFDALRMDSSKVLVHSKNSSVQGWDFEVLGSTPIQFSETSSDRPHLNFTDIKKWSLPIWSHRMEKSISLVRIEDSVTGREVFQLCGKYAEPSATQWDGQFLIAGYKSGEVLILDFSHVLV